MLLALAASLVAISVAALPARADGTIQLASIVAENGDDLSTIVITGTGLPIAPAGDIGEETGTSNFVEVADADSGFFDDGWDAGWNDDDCEVTIGLSTSSEVILSVGDQGTLCGSDDTIASGDPITVTLYNADLSTFGSATADAVSNPGNTPVVSNVNPPYGPEGGGTAAAPGTGTVLVETSNVSTPEAFWFAGTGTLSGFFGTATTQFSATGNPGEYAVVPPAYDFGGSGPENFGLSVYTVDSTNGMSQEDCTVEVTGCADEYFYLDSDSGSFTSPTLNDSLTATLGSAGGSGACGNIAAGGVSASLTVGGTLTGGPIEVSANAGFADANTDIPEAVVGGATITLESPVVVTVSLSGTLSACEQIPFPDLSLPGGLGGLYFVVGGTLTGSASLTITIDQGTYNISGGYIPGSQPDDIGGATVTSNCVDANGNPTTSCVNTALSASLTGTLTVAPLWLSFGPSELNVGAGLSATATGTITYPAGPGGPSVDYDICVGGNWTASVAFGSSFTDSWSGDWLGPFNIYGDGALCPLGAITTAPPAVTGVSPGTGSATGGTPVAITGSGFTGATAVDFGSALANSLSITDDGDLSVTAPPGTGTVDVTVIGPGGPSQTSSVDQFTYTGSSGPSVSSVSPSSGPLAGGTPITITGSGFIGGALVQIGQGNGPGATASAASDVDVVSPEEITAVTGPATNPGAWNVFVITSAGHSAANHDDLFTYGNRLVSSVSPSSGPLAGNTAITITGSGFIAGSTVEIGQGSGTGGTAIDASDVDVVSSTEITAVTGGPAEPGVWNVFVITAGGTTVVNNGDRFTYADPSVVSVSPSSGPLGGGTVITITGRGFIAGATVKIGQGFGTGAGAIVARVVSISATKITAKTGAAVKPGAWNVFVITSGGTSAVNPGDLFTYR